MYHGSPAAATCTLIACRLMHSAQAHIHRRVIAETCWIPTKQTPLSHLPDMTRWSAWPNSCPSSHSRRQLSTPPPPLALLLASSPT